MRKALAYILLMVALVSSCDRAKQIPQSTLSKIYAEMFLADQWISSNRLNKVADTSWVYEAIFDRYGYTGKDYNYSVERYMEDPEDFSRMIDKAQKILKARVADAAESRDWEILRDSLALVRKKLYRKFYLASDSLIVPSYTGVCSVHDKYNPYALGAAMPDSVWAGPELMAVDSVKFGLLDSLELSPDSLGVAIDSLAMPTDSLDVAVDSISQEPPPVKTTREGTDIELIRSGRDSSKRRVSRPETMENVIGNVEW